MTGLALGGGRLRGNRLVRYVYLDEAGISSKQNEPVLVVGGVLINGDEQWKPVEERLLAIRRYCESIGGEDENFALHAMEIFSPAGKYFTKPAFTTEIRFDILRRICEIPAEFGLPIIRACLDRDSFDRAFPFSTPKKQLQAALVYASAECTVMVEKYMRDDVQREEVATLIYEVNDQSRRLVREVHELIRNPHRAEMPVPDLFAEYIPPICIVDTAHFAEKRNSSPLQLADCVCFVMKRIAAKQSRCDDLYRQIISQIAYHDEPTKFKNPLS